MMLVQVRIAGLASVLMLLGCSGDRGVDTSHTGMNAALPEAEAVEPTVQLGAWNCKFKDGSGNAAFAISGSGDGGKLVDGQGETLARFRVDGDKVRVAAADGTTMGTVFAYPQRFKIKDSQDRELFEFQEQPDGDWKLKDADERLVYRIQQRKYGFEIEDAADASLFKVKLKEGKTSLRDSAEKTVFSTTDQILAMAVVPLGFQVVESMPLKCGMVFAIAVRIGQEPADNNVNAEREIQ